ncbi:MAG: trehalose-phosphatase [Pseudonocardiales bacterium]|nr:trehalose-phosphatase [Pseudonocardiales bacterium]
MPLRADDSDPRSALVAAVAAGRSSALIALDFDGTLAPLVDDPEQSRLAVGAAEVLTALAAAGVQIAVVTGRDATTVLRLSGLHDVPGLIVAGLYGAERGQAGDLETLPDQPALITAGEQLHQLVGSEPAAQGVWIEDKRLSLVVHARVAADPGGAINALIGPVRELAEEVGLEMHPGRNVLELRLPGYDKGTVLRTLVHTLDPSVTVYAGDDVGDLPAFAAIAQLRSSGAAAWSIAAGDPPLPEVVEHADLGVSGPADLVELLRSMLVENIPDPD